MSKHATVRIKMPSFHRTLWFSFFALA